MKIAVIDKNKSNQNYRDIFSFDFDLYHLTSKKVKKLLVKDIDIDIDIDAYDLVILIGADAVKRYTKTASVLSHQGFLVDDKFIPLSNPQMLSFKPAGKPAFQKAVQNIEEYARGERNNYSAKITLLNNEFEIERFVEYLLRKNPDKLCLDSETTALYPRDGYVLGISITFRDDEGYYIDADYLTEYSVGCLQQLWDRTKVIFHNAKFDMHFFKYHFGWEFKDFEDTILLHYVLDEQPGTHGLKQLAIKYTDMGDYDSALELFKADYCKKHGVKKADFTYDLIPFEVLGTYAAMDTIATWKLYHKFYPIVSKSKKLFHVYETLLKKGTLAMLEVEDNGVPFSTERLELAREHLAKEISNAMKALYNFESVHKFEKDHNKEFNPNSVAQVREVLFNYENIPVVPQKKTATGAISVDAEVLETLSDFSDLAKHILTIRKLKKIKSTYIDKVLEGIDSDSRLRTGFNLITTTSGRLSSSGKLNMQQLPRDNKIVKWCIKARDGWKIVSQDLSTAEMYIAAVLSGDKNLQNIFKTGGDYHGFMAVYKYDLPCDPNDVKHLYPDMRQSAKTISFEILYKLNLREPILDKFPALKRWLKRVSSEIRKNGYTYQAFGRKRRLPNVFSSSKADADHEVRSGVNSLVQGPASDVNLLACIDMLEYIKKRGMRAKIFGLVHDSILAEVPDEEIEEYSAKLKEFTQKDRGLSIPGTPIGVDLEIGQDYSFVEDYSI